MSVVTWISLAGNLANIAGHYLLMNNQGLGIIGSSISISCVNWLMFLLTLAYIRVSGLYKPTWPGWSREAFKNWDIFASLSLSGMAMMGAENLGYELGAVMSGIIGPVYTSALLIYTQVASFFYQLYASIGIACAVRIGYSLGAKDIPSARRATTVAYIWTVIFAVMPMTVSGVAARAISMFFTDQMEVVEVATEMLYIGILDAIPNSILTVQFGILRGCGRQKVGAVVTICTYFGIIIPIAVPLMFFTPLRSSGFIVALTIGMTAAAVTLSLFLRRMNWDEQCEKAQAVAGGSDFSSREDIALLSGVEPEPSPVDSLRPEDSTAYLVFKRSLTFLLCLVLLLAALYYKYQSGELDCVLRVCADEAVVRANLTNALEPTLAYSHSLPNTTSYSVYR